MDGRAFKLYYDWKQDSDGERLAHIISHFGHIAEGIIYEYYFSSIDPFGPFGGGDKANWNITGAVAARSGIMTDIRTGLPIQMTGGHEPVRPFYTLEAPVELVEQMLRQHPEVLAVFSLHWAHLLVKDPQTNTIHEWTDSGFVPVVRN